MWHNYSLGDVQPSAVSWPPFFFFSRARSEDGFFSSSSFSQRTQTQSKHVSVCAHKLRRQKKRKRQTSRGLITPQRCHNYPVKKKKKLEALAAASSRALIQQNPRSDCAEELSLHRACGGFFFSSFLKKMYLCVFFFSYPLASKIRRGCGSCWLCPKEAREQKKKKSRSEISRSLSWEEGERQRERDPRVVRPRKPSPPRNLFQQANPLSDKIIQPRISRTKFPCLSVARRKASRRVISRWEGGGAGGGEVEVWLVGGWVAGWVERAALCL